jgi:hypothetical protein
MRLSVLVLAAAMLTAAPAFAQTDPAAPPPAPEVTTTEPATTEPAATEPTTEPAAEAPAAQPARVCRTIQRTESRLRSRRERICHTQAQWDQMAQEAANLVNRTPAPRVEN